MSHKAWCSAIAVLAAWSMLGLLRADDGDTYNSVKELEAKRKQRQAVSQNLWWEHLIPGRMEEKKKFLEGKTEAVAKDTKEKEMPRPKPAETASAIQQETNKALRRAAVCDQLRVIAEETNDSELAKQADLIESKIWSLCEQKIASVRTPRMNPINEQDAEAKFLAESRNKSDGSARAEATKVRTIRSDEKE